eukprot:scaffold138825_cov29-Tisochrysis_lutea.AAC.1
MCMRRPAPARPGPPHQHPWHPRHLGIRAACVPQLVQPAAAAPQQGARWGGKRGAAYPQAA